MKQKTIAQSTKYQVNKKKDVMPKKVHPPHTGCASPVKNFLQRGTDRCECAIYTVLGFLALSGLAMGITGGTVLVFSDGGVYLPEGPRGILSIVLAYVGLSFLIVSVPTIVLLHCCTKRRTVTDKELLFHQQKLAVQRFRRRIRSEERRKAREEENIPEMTPEQQPLVSNAIELETISNAENKSTDANGASTGTEIEIGNETHRTNDTVNQVPQRSTTDYDKTKVVRSVYFSVEGAEMHEA